MPSVQKSLSRLDDHLQEVGETYPQHFANATNFALTMLAGGMACLIHALLPFLFTHTGSDCIRRLHREMVENRTRPPRLEPHRTA